MALTQKVLVEGTVATVSSRTIARKSDGQVFDFTDFVVTGPHSLVEVRVPPHLTAPKQGDKVRAAVRISTYRGDVEVTLDEYLG